MVTRGFTGRRPADVADRLPPGRHVVDNFPVLSAGSTPRIALDQWRLRLKVGPQPLMSWNWTEFNALPQSKLTHDIHDILAEARIEPSTGFMLAHSYGGYSTNLPVADLTGGLAMVALRYEANLWSRSRRAGAIGGATSLLLEIRQVVERTAIH